MVVALKHMYGLRKNALPVLGSARVRGVARIRTITREQRGKTAPAVAMVIVVVVVQLILAAFQKIGYPPESSRSHECVERKKNVKTFSLLYYVLHVAAPPFSIPFRRGV